MTQTPESSAPATYAQAGVDVAAGEAAVQLMKASVASATRYEVIGEFGGYAGLFDATSLREYTRPLLASSTDGVGTKVAIAQAMDKHDTIGRDLVAMVLDDIVVCGAEPLFMTDYIACGRVQPEKIATLVSGIAAGCVEAGCALIAGETAEHPGLLHPDEYDLAGSGTGVVEADRMLGSHRVVDGDVLIALASSGLHANGYSLVRAVLLDSAKMRLGDHVAELGRTLGEELLEPTRIYVRPALQLARGDMGVHAMAHITGGGLAANLSRVIPPGMTAQLDRGTWSPQPIFDLIASTGSIEEREMEAAFNMGVGMVLVVGVEGLAPVFSSATAAGLHPWILGNVRTTQPDDAPDAPPKGGTGGITMIAGTHPAH